MHFALYKYPLLACALALPGIGVAADSPAPVAKSSPSSDANAPTPIARPGDAPKAADMQAERQELEQMREQMREMSRKMAELSRKMGDVGPRAYAYRYLGDPDRGMIGVVFAPDKNGLRIDAVTPGGPADKSGLHDGDVVVAVDGKSVGGEKSDPSLHRISLGDLKIDQNIKLTVLRDGKRSDIALKAERREPYNFAYAFSDNDAHDLEQLSHLGETISAAIPPDLDTRVNAQVQRAVSQAERAAEHAQMQVRHALDHVSFSTPWWGLNLVSINTELGGYFGTDKGVLVLSADDEAFKGLKSGDVLLDVNGQKVERPEDALRLLRERPTGSDVKVQVLRQHKPLTLSVRAPEMKSIFVPPMPMPPMPPMQPMQPMQPVPPVPPVPPVAPRPPAEDDSGS